MFTLAGTWFYATSTDRDAVLALRNDVGRGEVITNDDLRVVQINSDDALNVLTRDEAGVIVGRVALSDLSAGTLVTAGPGRRGCSDRGRRGHRWLGAGPGGVPVAVHATRRRGAGGASAGEALRQTDSETVLAEAAEVVDVAPIGVQNQLFVSLALDTSAADCRRGGRQS